MVCSTKPNQEGVLVLNEQIVLEIIYLCKENTFLQRSAQEHGSHLRCSTKNQIQGGTKADSISAHRRRHDTNLNSEQVPYEAWHLLHHPWGRSICHILCSLAGDCCTSTSAQAERVFSWMGFLLNKRRLSLPGGERVTMQLFLNDNLELWVEVCLIPRWDDNKLWYPHIASKLICFPGDIFVLIGFVIIGG